MTIFVGKYRTCKIWSSRAEDVRLLDAFDHRCLLGIARIGQSDHVNDVKVRNLGVRKFL